jgi:putative heme transporter
VHAGGGVTRASAQQDPTRRGTEAEPPKHAPLRPQWWYVLGVALFAVALYVGLPRLVGGLGATWGRLTSGEPLWLCAAALFEVASYASYVWTFHRLFGGSLSRIGWRASYDISLAGVAASRLIATAGAGGIALTAWALERSGMTAREITSRLTTFYVALYALFMAALVITGVGLRTGLFEGRAPFALTVVPAAFGALVIACGLLAGRLSKRIGGQAADKLRRHGRAGRALATVVGGAGTVAEGVRGAVQLVRTRDPALLGAFGWWAFDIAVLWSCFRAFGHPPPAAVIVMSYFTGQLANVLPVPGGLGAVDGGMIGAFVGFGVGSGLAVTAVLSYRVFAYWLPTIPGALSYVRLLRTVSAWERERGAEPEAAS